MNTEEAIELITQNYSASEGSLIFSLHERNKKHLFFQTVLGSI